MRIGIWCGCFAYKHKFSRCFKLPTSNLSVDYAITTCMVQAYSTADTNNWHNVRNSLTTSDPDVGDLCSHLSNSNAATIPYKADIGHAEYYQKGNTSKTTMQSSCRAASINFEEKNTRQELAELLAARDTSSITEDNTTNNSVNISSPLQRR